MLKNYLVVALRSLRRRPGYTLINVAGLAVGLACCLLIGLFVREELRYDRFHTNSDRIVRIISDWGDFSVPATSWPFVKALETEHPDVEVATLLRYGGPVRRGDRHFREPEIFYANPALFEVFSFALERGDPASALDEPFTAVLSPTAARKYFGDADPVGQTLTLYGEGEVTVTGVLAPLAGPSHVTPDFVLSWATLDAYGILDSFGWGSNSVYTYLLPPEGTTADALEAALPGVIERHAGEDWNGAALTLQPLTDIHLHSHHNAELAPNGRASTVALFGAIAFFILLLAAVNFMNLATARSLDRAKEVGVRKSIGARRGQLAGQFLAEAVLLAVAGVLVAGTLVALALPAFRTLADRALAFDLGLAAPALLVALGLAVGVGLVAGSYPALVLSGFRPAEVLKGRFATSGRGAAVRKGLVVLQFSISVALLVSTLVVFGQLRFLQTASLGFDEGQLLSVTIPDGEQADGLDAFRAALGQHPEIEAVAASSVSFPSELLDGDGLALERAAAMDEFVGVRTIAVSPEFFDVLGVPVEVGRAFTPGSAADSSAIILNETAARMVQAKVSDQIATPEALVGEELAVNAPLSAGGQSAPVLGIVRDFNLATLHEAVEPMRFVLLPDRFRTFVVRTRPGRAASAVAALESAWQEVFPDALFEYRFADAAFDAAYRSEERLGVLFTLFAGLAVFIACLGLFGLAAYAAEQRRKEIGVRKVLGASVADVVTLLSRDFVGLVVAGFVVAVPLAWLAMSRWLGGFAYHVDLGVGPFIAAGAVALIVALVATTGQALRAAHADPARSLRAE